MINKLKAFLGIIAILILASCGDISSDDSKEEKKAAKQTVTFTFGTPYTRTALPTVDLASYAYTVTAKKGSTTTTLVEKQSLSNDSLSVQIEAGSYTFTVTAYNGETPVLEGSAEATISSNSKSVTVELKGVTGGTGSVEVTMKIANALNVAKVKAGLYDEITDADSGTEQTLDFTTNSGYTTVKYTNDSVQSGVSKWLIFFLYDDSDNLVMEPYSDSVYVVSGLKSTDEFTINSKTYTAQVSVQKNDGDWSDSGLSITLVNSSDSSDVVTMKAATGKALYTANVPESNTYKVYVSGKATKKTISSTLSTASLNYLVPAVYPAPGATDAFADTQLIMTFESEPALVADSSVVIKNGSETVDSISVNSTTNNEEQLAQSDYTIKVGNKQLVRVEGNSVYIQPHYNGTTSVTKLSWGTAYTADVSGIVEIPSAYDGMLFADGSEEWSFTTKAQPVVSTSNAITVSNATTSNSADFFSVYGALFYACAKSSGDYEIDITATGIPYYEMISVQSSGANVILRGMGSEAYGKDVVIEFINNNYMNASTHTRAALYYKGKGDLTLENLTVKNLTERNTSYTADGSHAASEFQAEALTFYTTGNLAAYNCSFVSKQDTILFNSGRAWFYKSHIEGDIDFIWGSPTVALIEECDIESILTEKNAYLTETRVGTVGASTVGKGIVFLKSTIKGNGGNNVTYLSRLASKNAKDNPSKDKYDQVAFINNNFDSSAKVDASLWHAPENAYPRFIEKDSNGNVNVGWKTYGNTGITPVTKEFAGEMTESLYAMEYNGRYAILNRVYNVDFSAYQTVGIASKWDLTSLETKYSASIDVSKNNAFTEPDTSTSTTTKWDFTTISSGTTYEGSTGTINATAGTGTLYVDATSGKLVTRGTDAQFNNNTIAYIPANVGDTVSVTLYYGNYTLGSKTATSITTEISVTADDLTTYSGVSCVALKATGNEYLYLISVVPGSGSGSSDPESSGIPASWSWTAINYATGITVDKTSVGDGTSLGNVSASGTGLNWRVSSGSAYCIETGKASNGCLTFTTSETASIVIEAASTGGSNTSDAVLSTSASENGAIAEAAEQTTVTGSSPKTTLTYNNVPAGKYYFGAFPATTNARGIRVYSITVTSGTVSVSSVAISGENSVKVGSSVTLTATPNVSTSSAYTWTVTDGTGSVTYTPSTTDTITLTGATEGTVTVKVSVDDADNVSDEITLTVKEAGFIPTISASDIPTGFAGLVYTGTPSSYTTVTVSTRSDLIAKAKLGNHIIYVDGMIDMTDTGSGTMIPESGGGTTDALDAFVASKTHYENYNKWRNAYVRACSTSTENGSSNKNDVLDGDTWVLNEAYKNIVQIDIASNTIIIGKTSSSGIIGGSINIGKSDSEARSNIVVRNLIIQDAYDPFPHHEADDGWNAERDGLVVQKLTSGIWIDHCTFKDTKTLIHVRTGATQDEDVLATSGSGTDEKWQTYDGLLDVKGTANGVTISYCKFMNHDKSLLFCSGSTDNGKKNITLDHNYFSGTKQRLPMVGYANLHEYNNYFGAGDGTYTNDYAIGLRYKAQVVSENNCFTKYVKYSYKDQGCKNSSESNQATKALLYASGDSDSSTGKNNIGSTYITSTRSDLFAIDYEYTLEDATTLESTLPDNAGAGKWNVEQ